MSDEELEVHYKLGGGGSLRSTSPVIRPDADDMRTFGRADARTCGQCKHFALVEGQRRIKAQRLVERVVREQGWKQHHLLVSPQNQMGICGAYESGAGSDSTVTGAIHAACDQFVAANGLLSKTRRSEHG